MQKTRVFNMYYQWNLNSYWTHPVTYVLYYLLYFGYCRRFVSPFAPCLVTVDPKIIKEVFIKEAIRFPARPVCTFINNSFVVNLSKWSRLYLYTKALFFLCIHIDVADLTKTMLLVHSAAFANFSSAIGTNLQGWLPWYVILKSVQWIAKDTQIFLLINSFI